MCEPEEYDQIFDFLLGEGVDWWDAPPENDPEYEAGFGVEVKTEDGETIPVYFLCLAEEREEVEEEDDPLPEPTEEELKEYREFLEAYRRGEI